MASGTHIPAEQYQPRSLPGEVPLRWTRQDLLCVALLCLGTAVAIWRFWKPGVNSEWDMLMGVYRIFALDRSFHQQVFWPRYALDIFCGYGGALFHFYPPLASYIGLVSHWAGFGWIEATKAAFTLALALAGLGSYVYARWLFTNRLAGLVAGFAYLLAPYLLLDIYERGAAAELLALSILPWLFWASHHILQTRTRPWFWTWLSGAFIALLMLAHNITALFTIPVVVLYLVVLAWRERVWSRLLPVGLALAGGFALSAFYWLPALAERELVAIGRLGPILEGNDLLLQHLYGLSTLVQPYLAFNYWDKPFHLSSWQAALGFLAVLAITLQRRALRYNLALLAGLLGLLLFLQLDLSQPFWGFMPLARYIQFPWRLLGPTALIIALLIGAVFCWRRLDGLAGKLLALGFIAFVAYAGLRRADPQQPVHWYPITNSEIGADELYQRGKDGYPLFTDYWPVSMKVSPCNLDEVDGSDVKRPAPLQVMPKVEVLSEGPFEMRFAVDASLPFTLGLPRVYFPGWAAHVNGEPVPTGPHDPSGLVGAQIPAGASTVVIQLGDTSARRLASLVSGLALLAFLVAGVMVRPARPILAGAIVIVALSALLMFNHQGFGQPPQRPRASPANFEETVQLLGYDLPRATWRPGEKLALRLYWLVQKAPPENYEVFLHLANLDDSGKVAQSDTDLMGGYNPAARWLPGELIVDERQLELGADVPPGTYRLLLGMYRPQNTQNLIVRGAPEVLPGNRVVLTEIEVQPD